MRSWARETFFAPPNHPENKVLVLREYVDFGIFCDLKWTIKDTRGLEQPLQPYIFQERCNTLHLQQEVEREVITPQVHTMLAQML